MSFPRRNTGSLGSTAGPRRAATPSLLGLSSSQSREHMPLRSRGVEIPPSSPLCAFVTLWKAAAPAKLSGRQGPPGGPPALAGGPPSGGGERVLGGGWCYRGRLRHPRDKVAHCPETDRTATAPSRIPSTPSAPGPSTPNYAMHRRPTINVSVESRFIGSSRPTLCTPHLHGVFNFTE